MKGTVLIIDDSAVMRKVILRTLKAGHVDFERVLEAGSGAEALALLRDNTVNLIMCDINMPGMSGLDLLKKLKDDELVATSVPIVMVTTEGGGNQVREALKQGARGYIRKPFTAEHIENNVKPLLAA